MLILVFASFFGSPNAADSTENERILESFANAEPWLESSRSGVRSKSQKNAVDR
jgi:hypothetical protein